jgi:hypothetical protein
MPDQPLIQKQTYQFSEWDMIWPTPAQVCPTFFSLTWATETPVVVRFPLNGPPCPGKAEQVGGENSSCFYTHYYSFYIFPPKLKKRVDHLDHSPKPAPVQAYRGPPFFLLPGPDGPVGPFR